MAAVAQYITVVDKSNKVVGTTKQLKNVFKEAKLAYLERKAEITAQRKAKEDQELHKARRAVEAMTIAETSSQTSSRRHHSRRHRDGDRRLALHDQHHSSASVASGYSSRSSLPESLRSRDSSRSPRTPLGQFNADLQNTRSAPPSPLAPQRKSNELIRRRTDNLALASQHPRPLVRSYSAADMDREIDMDLAYGEFHPESLGLTLAPDVEEKLQKQELASLVTKCKMLLDEANCAQHSVKAIVLHLQKNPDAMAAVALTLAEISNIATKMAPGALGLLKGTAPTVFAMLAAPEFLIAVGVGVGITVVMFGGYKIIKKIKARANKDDDSMDEALEVAELDRIENWRRGLADSQADETGSVISTATSVEGEYITPMAARSMGHLPQKSSSSKKGKEEKKNEKKHRKRDRSDVGSEMSKSSRRSEKSSMPKDKSLVKVKKPSPLRSMFRSRDTNSTAS